MKFDIEKTVTYWKEGAEYDLEVAESLLQSGKYPYALFFGHLALEKLLKALVVKQTGKHADYTHSLPLLAGKLKMELPAEISEKLAGFMEFYFESRYPEAQREFYKKCAPDFARKNLEEVRKVFKWFREKL